MKGNNFNNKGIPRVNDKINFESSDSTAYQLTKAYTELYKWMWKIFLSQ